MSTESPRCVITLCTYNERENISRLIPEIRAALPQADLLVVDDNSPDGTSDVVRQFSETDPQVHLLWRAGKEGLGAATLAGFQAAIERSYDFVLNMDADFSHHPRYLPALYAAMDRADVVIGSRYVSGGGITGWPFLRHFMSRGINIYSRWLLGLKSRDCSGAFRCYRISKLREIDFSKFRSRGYAFQEEMLYRCAGRLPARRGANRLRRPDRGPVQNQPYGNRSGAAGYLSADARPHPRSVSAH